MQEQPTVLSTPSAQLTADSSGAEDMVRAEKLRILGEMASGIIHDVNNMLGAILGRAQLIRLKSDVDEIKRHVEQIEMIALQGGETVKRLQEFSRVGQRAEAQPTELNLVVADALEVTRHRWETQAQGKGIFYTVETKLCEDAIVNAVRSELVDAVANLIFNALDAMPSGGPLLFETQCLGDRCTLTVADEGIGISQEQMSHVFSPFYTTKGTKGTGLGLAVVYGVVTRHGGDVNVESVPGRGSRFTIRLARSQRPVSAANPPISVKEDGSRRVLLVDDDATILDVIGEALREVGHDVRTCDSGAAAIVAMEEAYYDVLITDLGMPGVSGWDVAKRARQIDPPLPVVVISGWGAQITNEQLKASGVEKLLAKPFRLEQIRQAITSMPRRRAG
jgi:CheY-like chemotaxis protein